MKKIGIDARFYSFSCTGVGRHVYELIQGLAKLDTKNQYTVFLDSKFYNYFKPPAQNFYSVKASSPIYSLSEQTKFLLQLNQYDFDLMVFPQFNAPVLYNKPYVVTIHDLTLHFYSGRQRTSFISKLAYRLIMQIVTWKAKTCFAVSQHTKKDMTKILGIPSSKVVVTYNGVTDRFKKINDQALLKSVQEKYSLGEKYFLYSGARKAHKNIIGMIKGFATFLETSSVEYQLALTGPKGGMDREIKKEILDLGLEGKIKILGLVSEEELLFLMNGSRAYVFPSFYEGFGLPPLEAMQCEVPVICSNASCLPEVCGEAVEYFNPSSIEEMAKAMKIVAFDEKRRNQLIEKGRFQCRKFSWDTMCEQMFSKYGVG